MQEDKNVVKERYAIQYRTLADGTKKAYRTKKTYKISGKDSVGRPAIVITTEQENEIMAKYSAGVKIRRICQDVGIAYLFVKRVIDKNKKPDEKPQSEGNTVEQVTI